ncbi:MAG TPA: exodeoxyribonuclease VII small subunit [Desulfosporosinus sp.]|nr:exodeoxyribonuclease VII small subunit [Desulfosporosinus sp.]
MSKEKWTDDLFVRPSELEETPVTFDEQEEETVSLETGLQHLEKIVKTLEQKDLPLEKALSLFKEGVGLVQYCSSVLNQAEKQMEILLVGPDGQLQIKPASFEMEG